MKIRTKKLDRLFVCALGVCGLISISQVGWAQTEPESATSSYNARWREFKPGSGTKDVDPNVYVYTAEFAKRFQMPSEWISTELKGADAVAMRITPNYATCGWGGDPKACRMDEVRCEIDVYFDHKRNPLPWDERYPDNVTDGYRSSSHFIPGLTRESRLPEHLNNLGYSNNSPFIDPLTSKGLGWQDFKKGANGAGWTVLINYDKEVFVGVALITLSTSCDSPRDELLLTSGYLYARDVPGSLRLKRRVELPVSWQIRVQQAMQETNERSESFFKREGEKAMKILLERAIPKKSIIPMQ